MLDKGINISPACKTFTSIIQTYGTTRRIKTGVGQVQQNLRLHILFLTTLKL